MSKLTRHQAKGPHEKPSKARKKAKPGSRLYHQIPSDAVERKVHLDPEHHDLYRTLQTATILLTGRSPSLGILVCRGLEVLAERYKAALADDELHHQEVVALRRLAPAIDGYDRRSDQRSDKAG